eukprot:2588908-Rhodomonas_salina.2
MSGTQRGLMLFRDVQVLNSAFSYAMSGTETVSVLRPGYRTNTMVQPARRGFRQGCRGAAGRSLCARYGMSSTDVAYGATVSLCHVR